MVPQLNKILFATDLSENARIVFGYAAYLANLTGATIVIVHVLDNASQNVEAMVVSYLGENRVQELYKKKKQEAKKILIAKKREAALIQEALSEFCKDATSALDKCNITIEEIVIVNGNIVDQIIAEAEYRGCDLIVMGHTSRGLLTKTVIGNISKEILKRSNKPILIVPLKENQNNE